MRVVVTSSKSWDDEASVRDALSEVPTSATVLLPSNEGACAIVRAIADEFKLEIEDWSSEDYDSRGSFVNADMLNSDVDMCIAFDAADSHAVKDCVRRARSLDLDVKIINSP